MDVDAIRKGLEEVERGTTPDKTWVNAVNHILSFYEDPSVEESSECDGECCGGC